MRKALIFLAVTLTVPLSGCLQQIAVSSLGGIMENGFTVLNEEQDLTIAEQSASSNLKLLEAVLQSDPDNERYLLLASEGYSSYALAFAEDESADRARLFYLRGKSYGMRILTHHKEFADAVSRGEEEFAGALQTFSRSDVPAVFWTAVGWGSAIGLSLTDPAAIADLPKVEAMMKFVAQYDSSYFYGGAYFFLGTLAGSRPPILGGDTTRSRSYFERCLATNNGNFLMTYVYFARSYAVQTQNKEFFEQCLTRVDTTSIDILPEARLSNAVAKKKAHLLRARIDQLF